MSADFPALGREMHALATELFPITRSLAGPGFRETLDRLEEVTGPMRRHRFATGEQVFDWRIPREWSVRDAWIRGPDGSTVCTLADNNLHVVSYSTPVRTRMGLDELQAHLHSLPDQPDAIPYRTSYYEESWGFCLTDTRRSALTDGEYEVCIDADLNDGELTLGEVVVEGTSEGEVLLSTYCCHPSMANNELSGPVLCAVLARLLAAGERPRHTYRFLFVPETIGAIAYLARFGDRLRAHLLAGWVVTCIGDPGAFTYKRSRQGGALCDRIAEHVLGTSGAPHSVEPFLPWGSDERQYCSPGFDLPVGSLMRTMYGRYPEYHTSLDDLDLVTADALGESLRMYHRMLAVLEANEVLTAALPHGEPQLSPRGLYPSTGGGLSGMRRLQNTLCVLNFCDGTTDLLAVAERTQRSVEELREAAEPLLKAGLIHHGHRSEETRGSPVGDG